MNEYCVNDITFVEFFNRISYISKFYKLIEFLWQGKHHLLIKKVF